MLTLNIIIDSQKAKTVVIPESLLKYKGVTTAAPKPTVPKAKAIENNPLVQFRYPKSNASWDIPLRTVRLISADTKYFWGLEITRAPGSDKLSYRPKRYLRSKATQLDFIAFNKPAMP